MIDNIINNHGLNVNKITYPDDSYEGIDCKFHVGEKDGTIEFRSSFSEKSETSEEFATIEVIKTKTESMCDTKEIKREVSTTIFMNKKQFFELFTKMKETVEEINQIDWNSLSDEQKIEFKRMADVETFSNDIMKSAVESIKAVEKSIKKPEPVEIKVNKWKHTNFNVLKEDIKNSRNTFDDRNTLSEKDIVKETFEEIEQISEEIFSDKKAEIIKELKNKENGEVIRVK